MSKKNGIIAELLKVSTEVKNLIGADLHSISLPVPVSAPTHLRIAVSSDPQAEKIVGMEFPIDESIAGWVYENKCLLIKNPEDKYLPYFDKIDKTAGTHTGEGAILTLPIISSGTCRGVIQFMKGVTGHFGERDVERSSGFLPDLARLIGLLAEAE